MSSCKSCNDSGWIMLFTSKVECEDCLTKTFRDWVNEFNDNRYNDLIEGTLPQWQERNGGYFIECQFTEKVPFVPIVWPEDPLNRTINNPQKTTLLFEEGFVYIAEIPVSYYSFEVL